MADENELNKLAKALREPTNFDLQREQTRQAMVLDSLSSDISEIKEVLVGGDKRQGIVMDVDRLKQTDARRTSIVWVLFTTCIGIIAATFTSFIAN